MKPTIGFDTGNPPLQYRRLLASIGLSFFYCSRTPTVQEGEFVTSADTPPRPAPQLGRPRDLNPLIQSQSTQSTARRYHLH